MKDHLLMDDPVVSTLYIEVHKSGAVQVQGSIQDEKYALNMLEASRDAIKNYHKKDKPIIIPHAL